MQPWDINKSWITLFNPIPFGLFCVLILSGVGGGGANLPPPLFFLNIHAMAMKIGMNMFSHLKIWPLYKKIQDKSLSAVFHADVQAVFLV